MLRFLVRVLVNTLAIALTIAVLPGATINDEVAGSLLGQVPGYELLIYPLAGLILALVQLLFQPVVLLLTARLMLWSMGLSSVLLNALFFALFVHPWWDFARYPFVVGGLIGGTLAGLLITLLNALSGLDSPLLDPARQTSKAYWRWLGQLPHGRLAEQVRIAQAYETMRRYLIQIAVSLTPLAGLRQGMQRLLYRGAPVVSTTSVPEIVRLLLQDLGPTYVKLGQVIASRTEMLPPPWQRELSRLHSSVDPFPYAEARRIITEELGAPPEECFACFEPTPLAAASIGQVYRARRRDGQAVVVKVQRPDIDVTMRADLGVMRDAVRLLEARLPLARELNLVGVVDEFADSVVTELDFQNEAAHIRRLGQTMAVFPAVQVPRLYDDVSTARVLTMECVSGIKLTELAALDAAGVDRAALATTFMRAMLKQVLLDGYFHGDPHPGNILVDPQTGRLIFLDMGLMGSLSEIQRLALIDVIWSLKARDAQNLAHIMLTMAPAFKVVDQGAFTRDLERLVRRALGCGDSLPALATVLQELTALMHRHGLGADPGLTLAMKALVQAEQLIRQVAPEVSLVDTAFGELTELLQQDYAREAVAETVKKQALGAAKDLLRHVPQLHAATLRWLEQYEHGRLTLYLESDEQLSRRLEGLGRRVERGAGRLTLGLVLSGLLVSSALAGGRFQMPHFGDPTSIVFTVAGLLGLGLTLQLAWSMLRKA
ncbi:MAG: hypothetical protein HGA45_15035 [Chloroflexales bacterium]|nr:hypothetical protein [Chloroflexales bacterium]